ncbi:ATP-binding protein [Flavobacterium sp. F372]|uniref:histidine kinase n=1 Tax=Flavobacterium bernardetii TaxID=2813823 RepID=A0ABR7IV58_9FLAO|nr:tetratricopeptide repeat-containing sensor histidine kinase [Flavobacterium bernardetii]MBC5833679.1 ATP-binding protein [Flavobacterium bernardetii]NHF68912.1 ATP-binding protein [Flavobacterium bernardetii]
MKNSKLFFLILISIFSCRKDRDDFVIKDDVFTSNDYIYLSLKDKQVFLDSINNLVDDIEVDSIKMNKLLSLSSQYYFLKENRKSFQLTKKAYKIAEQTKDSFAMGRSLYYMSDCYRETNKDSAFYYLKQSEKIYLLIKNDDRLAKVHYNKAYLLFYEGNYTESEIEVIKSLKYLKNVDNLELLYMCNSLQGSNHTELEEYNKALGYFNQASFILKKMQKERLNLEEIYCYSLINTIDICNIYDKKKQYSKSVSTLKSILSEDIKKNKPGLYHTINGNLAYSLMKSGNYEEAKKHFDLAIQFSDKKDDSQSYLYKIINFGEYHLLTKDTVKANALFTEALQMSKQLKSGNEELKTLNFLALTNPKKVTHYKNEYVRVSDSIVKKQRASRDKFARIEFETSQVEDQNKMLSYRNLVLVLIIIISIIVFLLILYFRHRAAAKKEMQLLEQKNIADKELFKLTNDFQIELVNAKQNEQNRISKELHDGIMNQIYGVRLNLGFLNEYDDTDSKDKRLILVKELQKIEGEIRTLSHDLSSENNFNNSDFTYLLDNLIKSNNNISNTEFTIEITDFIDWNRFSSLIKINMYRILQELFLNVNKYSNAKACTLKIETIDNQLHVSVSDDGVGFNTSKTSEGIGLKNIKERLELINGTLTVLSSPNEGAKFNLVIPIA